MVLFLVFCVAAGIVTLAALPAVQRRWSTQAPRREGVAFVGAVIVAAGLGLALHSGTSLPTPALTPILPFGIPPGVALLLLTGALYVVSALRGARRLPTILADVALLLAAGAAVWLFGDTIVRILRSPTSTAYIDLGQWAVPLSIAWMWAIARMTAALNRMPQVTGGYLGIVALTLLLMLHLKAGGSFHFPSVASAALAGAGLATLPLAIRRADFNLGWSAALAMGFLLAQIATLGLLKNTTFAILSLSLLTFGVPILDVSFYRLRTALRGKKVTWEEQRLRLHEALLRRGVSPLRIAVLYLAIGVWLCGMGVLLARFVLAAQTEWWRILLRLGLMAVVLFGGLILFFSVARILMRRTANEEIPEDVEAFGVRISPVTMTEALDKIDTFIQERQPHHVVTSDANAILRAQKDAEYAEIIRRAALITPDGFGVIWGARLLNLPIYERVTGVDMVTGICERAAQKGYSIYILGSAPGIASTAAQKLMERYPGLKVAGTRHGFFKPEEEDEIVRAIRESRPDVLFVAFGIPKQEKFIARHLQALNAPVSLGVGGSFDVYSEKLRRAPEYVQRSGLEWLYRVWQEPWRWKRMSYVPRFMAFALREWLFGSQRARRNLKKLDSNHSKISNVSP